MKRFMLVIFIALFIPNICYGAGYFLGNYAIGGTVEESSMGIEMGAIFLSDLHPTGGAFSFGLGLSIADTDDNPPETSSAQKEFNDGNEQEIDLTFGAELAPSFFATMGVGYATQKVVTVGQSGEVDSGHDNNMTGMLSLRYVIQGLNIGLGYNTRRGIMASAGIAF